MSTPSRALLLPRSLVSCYPADMAETIVQRGMAPSAGRLWPVPGGHGLMQVIGMATVP